MEENTETNEKETYKERKAHRQKRWEEKHPRETKLARFLTPFLIILVLVVFLFGLVINIFTDVKRIKKENDSIYMTFTVSSEGKGDSITSSFSSALYNAEKEAEESVKAFENKTTLLLKDIKRSQDYIDDEGLHHTTVTLTFRSENKLYDEL